MIQDNFAFCEVPKVKTAAILNINHKCQINIKYPDPKVKTVSTDFVSCNSSLLSIMAEQVKGKGIECQKEVIGITWSKTWSGYEQRKEEIINIQLSKRECIDMYENMRCEDGKMTCENDNNMCTYSGMPKDDYSFWYTKTGRGVRCKVTSRVISAKTLETKLFNTECRPRDLYCRLKYSTIYWDSSILHECPFNFIEILYNVSITKDIAYHDTTGMAFQIVNMTKKYDSVCKTEAIFQTSEGLFLTRHLGPDSTRRFSHSKTHKLKEMHEVIIAEADGEKYRNYKEQVHIQNEMCENFRNNLHHIKSKQDGFYKIDDYLGVSHILYVDSNIIMIPSCVIVKNVTVSSKRVDCDVEVTFGNNYTGFLNSELIISKEKTDNCKNKQYIYLAASNKVIIINRNSVTIENLEHIVQINGLMDMEQFKQLQFIHNQILLEDDNMINEINQQHQVDTVADYEIDKDIGDKSIFITNEKLELIKTLNYFDDFWRYAKRLGTIAFIVTILIIAFVFLHYFILWKCKINAKQAIIKRLMAKPTKRSTPFIPVPINENELASAPPTSTSIEMRNIQNEPVDWRNQPLYESLYPII
jgi:hypothetical protein